MDHREYIRLELTEAAKTIMRLATSEDMLKNLEAACERMTSAVADGHRVFFCGNGGSAAEAAHLAAEFAGRFRRDRSGYPAMSLGDNVATLTAIANDYSFDGVYARQVRSYARSGDILVAMSTSGNSRNVVLAAREALGMGVCVIVLTGEANGELGSIGDIVIQVPSGDTAHIQEAHLAIGHVLAGVAERGMT